MNTTQIKETDYKVMNKKSIKSNMQNKKIIQKKSIK